MSEDATDKLLEKLKLEGWHLTTEGLDLVTNNGTVKDYKRIVQNALNYDLKEIGKSILNEKLSNKQLDNIVLQIQKVKNISAPKANEESQTAPRMLKLILTDGHSHCQAIETTHTSTISLNKTAPGTKILLKNASICSGFVFMTPQSVTVLGGYVTALYEKWEVNKNISNFKRASSESDGPPPWVNFGKKIASESQKDFKSLEEKSKDDPKQSEFDVQRSVAIAEAASGAVKKVFGGGVKPLLNEKMERKPQYVQKERNNQPREPREYREQREPRGKRREPRESKQDMIQQQKPSEKVSLFSFLEDKLPAKQQNTATTAEKPLYNDYKYNQFSNNHTTNTNSSRRPYSQSHHQPNKYHQQDAVENVTNNMERLNVNASFASKAFKQHLKLPHNQQRPFEQHNDDFGGPKMYNNKNNYQNQSPRMNSYANNQDFGGPKFYKAESQRETKREDAHQSNGWQWKIGDLCMAKYWEDNKYYNAVIECLTERTCVVKFNDYGNMEEVLQSDCIPVTAEEVKPPQKYFNGNDYKHTGNRNFVNKNYRRQH